MKFIKLFYGVLPFLFFSCSGNGDFIPMNPKGPEHTSSVLQTIEDFGLVGDVAELKEYTYDPEDFDLTTFDEYGNVKEKISGGKVTFRADILDGRIVSTRTLGSSSNYYNEVEYEGNQVKEIRNFRNGDKTGFTKYIYRPDGQLDYEANFSMDRSFKKQNGLAKYEYNKQGRVISRQLGYYSSQKDLYTYKGNSVVIDSVYYSGGSKLTSYSVNKYRNGNLVEKTTYSSREDTSGEIEVFEYDKYGNLVRSYLDDGRVKKNLKRVKYEYDKEKNWTMKEVFIDGRLDSRKNRIITYRRYKYLF